LQQGEDGECFLLHGILALIVQSFPDYFAKLSVGLRVSLTISGNFKICTLHTSGGDFNWANINIIRVLDKHRINLLCHCLCSACCESPICAHALTHR
jgi:hypothetical protein